MTSTITWNDFTSVKPPAIYYGGQNDSRNFYFVTLPRKQVTVLQWHASRSGRPEAQWEGPNGKKFNGEVLLWASEPAIS